MKIYKRTTLVPCLLVLGSVCLSASSSEADENARRSGTPGPARTTQRLSEARRVATEKRREWIRKHLIAEVQDPRQIQQLNAKLDALDDHQVDVAAAQMLEQLDKRRQQANLNRAVSELARARETRDALQRRAAAAAYASPSRVGFFPVITVLPQGASLTASAVVSPDRRHVRVNVNPFFSSIGPVDTFNFFTGETRRPPELNPQLQQPPPASPRYDGLRTRSDRIPRR